MPLLRKFKPVVPAFMVLLALACVAGIPTGPTSVTLAWDTAAAIDVFKIYSSTNVQAPLGTWTLMTNIPGTVVTSTNSFPATNTQVVIQPGYMFFYLTASNLWGESGPSNITNTPAVPIATNLNLHR